MVMVISQTKQRAFDLFTQAANKGNINAQYQCGWCLYHGVGVHKNRVKSCELFLKSAEQGNNYAEYSLANYFYDNYDTVKEDK